MMLSAGDSAVGGCHRSLHMYDKLQTLLQNVTNWSIMADFQSSKYEIS